jgi:hypothetical protein
MLVSVWWPVALYLLGGTGLVSVFVMVNAEGHDGGPWKFWRDVALIFVLWPAVALVAAFGAAHDFITRG